MKNSKIGVLFGLLSLVACARGQDCESIPVARVALDTCATPDEQKDRKALLSKKCIAACLAAEWGFLDDTETLSLDQINEVFYEYIKDENLKKQLADIHEKCVKQALQETETCESATAYSKCLGADKDLKEIVDTKYCPETADAYLVAWK